MRGYVYPLSVDVHSIGEIHGYIEYCMYSEGSMDVHPCPDKLRHHIHCKTMDCPRRHWTWLTDELHISHHGNENKQIVVSNLMRDQCNNWVLCPVHIQMT